MELTTNQIVLPADGSQAGDVIRRDGADHWYVPFKPFQPGQPVDWKVFKRDDNVYIPLVPYLSAPDPAQAMAFMCQLGASIALQLPGRCARLHLAFGHEVRNVEQGGQFTLQTHVGFGFLLER